MKQSLPLPAIVGIIAVVVVLVALIGWKLFLGSNGSSGKMPEAAKAEMEKNQQNMHYHERAVGGAPNGVPGAGVPGAGAPNGMGR